MTTQSKPKTTLADLVTIPTTPTAQPLVPSAEAEARAQAQAAEQLSRQYTKACDGLWEAYKFGAMLLKVKTTLENHESFSGVLSRENARETTVGKNGNALAKPGWNAGYGLSNWLKAHCPEVNYKTAMKFLQIARQTHAALAPTSEDAWGGASDAPAGVEGAAQAPSFPSEAAIRDFLAGKSQREVLARGGKREGAGRPKRDVAAVLEQAPEVAFKEIEGPLSELNELIVVQKRAERLSALDLSTVASALRLLLRTVEELERA